MRYVEIDLLNGSKIDRSYFNDVNGDVLAIDEYAATETFAAWYFNDLTGQYQTLGSKTPSGTWTIQHRLLDEFGNETGRYETGTKLDAVSTMWHGSFREDLGNGYYNYAMGTRWFNPVIGRFLSEDPRGSAGGQTNLYLLDGNDPYARNQHTGIDWTKVEGPNADGHNAVTRTISVATGYADAFTFGGTGALQRYIYGDAMANSFQTNGYYYGGLAFGVAATIYVGVGASGVATTSATATRLGITGARLTRGIQAYNIIGDVVGVAQSGYHASQGDFSPLNLLGFAPTIGWIGGVTRRIRSTTFRKPSLLESIVNAASFERQHFSGRFVDEATLVNLDIQLDELYRSHGLTFEGIYTNGPAHSQFVERFDDTGILIGGRIELIGTSSRQPVIRVLDEISHAMDVVEPGYREMINSYKRLAERIGPERVRLISHAALFERAAMRLEAGNPILRLIMRDEDVPFLRLLADELRK